MNEHSRRPDTDVNEYRGYSAALQTEAREREARETEVEEKQEKRKTFYDRTRASVSVGDTDEKDLGRLSECVQRTVPSTDAPVDI